MYRQIYIRISIWSMRRYGRVHRLLSRFAELVSEGTIEDLKPIPNKTFTFEELEYLYNEGYIYENNDVFYANVPASF